MTRSEKLRRKGHNLYVAAALGWPIFRNWRKRRANELFERADIEAIRERYA